LEEHQNNTELEESNFLDLDRQIQETLKRGNSLTSAFTTRILKLKFSKGPLTGITLLGIGGASLLLSYLVSSSILTFIGLGLTLWGVLILYVAPSRHVRAEMLNSISSSMQKCVDSLVAYMGYTGQVIFFHPKSLTGLGQGYIFIPHYAAKAAGILNSKVEALNALPYSSESNIPSVFLDPKGIFLPAPSQGLVDLFEKELGVNFASVDMAYVQQNIPRLLIEELNVIDDMSIEQNSDGIVMKSTGGPCTDMCKFMKESHPQNNLACPLCSAMALIVSKVWGKPIVIKETIATDGKITTTYVELTS